MKSNIRILLAVCLTVLLMTVTACDFTDVLNNDAAVYPQEWDSYQYGEKLHCVKVSAESPVNCYSPVSSGG